MRDKHFPQESQRPRTKGANHLRSAIFTNLQQIKENVEVPRRLDDISIHDINFF